MKSCSGCEVVSPWFSTVGALLGIVRVVFDGNTFEKQVILERVLNKNNRVLYCSGTGYTREFKSFICGDWTWFCGTTRLLRELTTAVKLNEETLRSRGCSGNHFRCLSSVAVGIQTCQWPIVVELCATFTIVRIFEFLRDSTTTRYKNVSSWCRFLWFPLKFFIF